MEFCYSFPRWHCRGAAAQMDAINERWGFLASCEFTVWMKKKAICCIPAGSVAVSFESGDLELFVNFPAANQLSFVTNNSHSVFKVDECLLPTYVVHAKGTNSESVSLSDFPSRSCSVSGLRKVVLWCSGHFAYRRAWQCFQQSLGVPRGKHFWSGL